MYGQKTKYFYTQRESNSRQFNLKE